MDMELLLKWAALLLALGNTVAQAVLWLYLRYGDRNKEITRKFETIESGVDHRLDEQDKAIAHLSGLIERAPTHNDLSALYEKVNNTAQAVSHMAGELRGINENLRLILSRVAERGMK